MQSRRLSLKFLTFGFLLVLFSFFSAEMLLDAFAYWVPQTRIVLDPVNAVKIETVLPDPVLGKRLNPLFPGHDRRGFRNPKALKKAEIVALGDSQTYGTAVNPGDDWPAVLSKIAGQKIYNMGVSGYGPVQYSLLLKEALELDPEIVIVGFYFGNDLYDAYHMAYSGEESVYRTRNPQVLQELEMLQKTDPLESKIEHLRNVRNKAERERQSRYSRQDQEKARFLSRLKLYQMAVTLNDELHSRQSAEESWQTYKSKAAQNPDNFIVFENGNLRTLFLEEYRFLGINLDDARIAEGFRITKEIFIQMDRRLKAEHRKFLVLLIPTKESVFAGQTRKADLKTPPFYERIVTEERKIREETKRFLTEERIAFIDLLPALSQAVDRGINPYKESEDGHPNAEGNKIIAEAIARDPALNAIHGPLRADPANPRYFSDANGKPVYLTGSHIWWNLQDMFKTFGNNRPQDFSYERYLDFMESNHQNFMRMWRWEVPKYLYRGDPDYRYVDTHPWMRTGPGIAADGFPKFDLARFNPAYFNRLRARILAAKQKGIYVSVMLFEGNALGFAKKAWFSHPFNFNNNVNGIDGDSNKDGKGTEIHTLKNPEVLRAEEAYVRKVVETVGDLDNVLYEISNETFPQSTAWQYHMIDFIRKIEKEHGKQHPVGITCQAPLGNNEALLKSPADWISPCPAGMYPDNPPANSGPKVVIVDTDHMLPSAKDNTWTWKCFTRGLNVILMDRDLVTPYPVRKHMAQTAVFAKKIDLAHMAPDPALCSTTYCLAKPSPAPAEYLIYAPYGGSFSVDLRSSGGELAAEWFSPDSGRTFPAQNTQSGQTQRFIPPFSGPAVLYLKNAS